MVDIVVLGATGYTGRLIARYLATHPQRSSFTFGLAARSQSALEGVFRGLNLSTDDVPAFTVDVTKPSDVSAVVQQARVVINTIGPYWRWGTSVVRACVHHGKHYVDLTGEPHWVKDIIFELDYAALKSGSIVVPCCGLDSVPSDVLAFIANKTLKSFGGPSATIDLSTSAWELGGASISGGTFSTILTALEDVPKQTMLASGRDFALSPVKGPRSPRPRMLYNLPYSDPPVYGAWYFMVLANRQVVQRSWGLFELACRANHHDVAAVAQSSYGPNFKYEEFVVQRSALYAVMYSTIFSAIAGLLVLFLPVRWFAQRIMPSPGEGPSEKQLQTGSLEITNITTSSPNSKGEKIVVRSIFRGRGDPGYLLSSIIISECALALALDGATLPQISKSGGVLTPMTAFGDILIERLRRSGRIDVESELLVGTEPRKTR
ncbi:Saccharopine dehydrogenase-domain-containing protein [Suillus clintonianus]|uniref:Saccharopine dehydrogenase-domain-containing protein n=1 Tax=Suillus clintonianus TaxID=1904413 RepID=UPI001B863533|nr:Saccharopine dehydrogenase-domain-containing protein [Suillus clintonianus]KAG2153387.1 Saccharopine dehydrogenase-domain-containing protein [Suillus clintonianus]